MAAGSFLATPLNADLSNQKVRQTSKKADNRQTNFTHLPFPLLQPLSPLFPWLACRFNRLPLHEPPPTTASYLHASRHNTMLAYRVSLPLIGVTVHLCSTLPLPHPRFSHLLIREQPASELTRVVFHTAPVHLQPYLGHSYCAFFIQDYLHVKNYIIIIWRF